MKTKPRGRRTTNRRLYDVEEMYKNIFSALVHDLTQPGTPERRFGIQKMMNHRQPCPFGYDSAGAQTFKVCAQIEHFHKRLIFKTDNSFEDLSRKSFQDFVEFQRSSSLMSPIWEPVVVEARRIVSDILGPFDLDQFGSMCSFPTNAAQDLPRRKSYTDIRVTTLNGSHEQLNLFNEIRARDVHLLRATRLGMKSFAEKECAIITSVPKSYKAARIIGPDTTVGGFLSRGMGVYLRDRIEASTHIDLAKQQFRHQEWVRQASTRGHLATLDMSKASDSFTWKHLSELLPADWFNYVRVCSLKYFSIPELGISKQPLASAMLMGSGHTFALQTLLFYALSLSTSRLLNVKGVVSVYGDDIIVPDEVAPKLARVLTDLGFAINEDKSFWSHRDDFFLHYTFFRESCGADFYAGIPVRPWMPECETGLVTKNLYLAELHKALNRATSVWHPVELPGTMQFIIDELRKLCVVSFVPDTETETSGVHLRILQWLNVDWKVNVPRCVNGILRYTRLTQSTKKRVSDSRAHYWEWLQRHTRKQPDDLYTRTPVSDGKVGTSFRREARRGEKVLYRWAR